MPAIRNSQLVTLILVTPAGQWFAVSRGDKDALLAARKPGDVLLAAWTGQFSTDIFAVTDEDLATRYR